MSRQIVIVEDELAIARNYQEALQRKGFDVRHYMDRPSAIAGFEKALPDLAIIDVELGSEVEGGFELCRQLRSLSEDLPIIFLTARDEDFDVISGLRLGADDYLTKDISLPQLMARILALFRRVDTAAQPTAREQEVVTDDLCINMDRMRVTWKQQPIDLTVTELWILHALAQHPGHIKNRQQLMDAANVVLDDNTITSHIKRIRKKFRQHDATFDSIQTAYGMGYRWLGSE